MLNLCDDDIPPNQQNLLNLGPKFVATPKSIPYMDIISKTKSTALKLHYDKKTTESQKPRQDVLRVLKMANPMKPNLNLEQRKAIKELQNDETISIYSFDKGAGLVRIKNEDAMEKIQEQIGNTTNSKDTA